MMLCNLSGVAMNKFLVIPNKIINRFAKSKSCSYYGRDREQIISDLIYKGYERELSHLANQFSFTEKTSGLIIEKPLVGFPSEVDTPEKFLSSLVQRE